MRDWQGAKVEAAGITLQVRLVGGEQIPYRMDIARKLIELAGEVMGTSDVEITIIGPDYTASYGPIPKTSPDKDIRRVR